MDALFMPKSKSLERFKTRKILQQLAEKKGYGTELFSLYIPQGKQISDVQNYLKQEYGTATNIKSKTTQKNVQSAITTIQQKLKIIPQSLIDEYSLVIFCGAIPQNGGPGTEKMEIYPQRVTIRDKYKIHQEIEEIFDSILRVIGLLCFCLDCKDGGDHNGSHASHLNGL